MVISFSTPTLHQAKTLGGGLVMRLDPGSASFPAQ
jgi:hypothetical protein